MKRFIFILSLLLAISVSCENSNHEYPEDINGLWVSVDNPDDWISISDKESIVHLTSDNQYFYTGWAYYIRNRGYAVIPNEDESSRLSIIKLNVDDTDPEDIGLVVTGQDKDLHDIFTFYMTQETEESPQ